MKNIQDLKSFLIQRFPDARIYLFGSRARGDAVEYSDIDIAIKSEKPLRNTMASVRFVIEESQFPYKVDLVDLSLAPHLENTVEKEGILWH